MVYPVYSRRSRGLSVGVNLFPGGKVCSFDCPYCEVFPFKNDIEFSLKTMESGLRRVLDEAAQRGETVRDICFSGNGEPTMSPHFIQAAEAALRIRDEGAPAADLVVISNGAGLLNGAVFTFLRNAARGAAHLRLWLKLDAGTEGWYRQMDRSALPFADLIAKIREFAASAPFVIQTMICAVEGNAPPPDDAAAWEALVLDLPPGLTAVQLYGKARPAPEDPLASALPAAFLEERAASLGEKFRQKFPSPPPVEVFP
ncbi:radical SAM protein [Spirochaetia bacterium]|nr:radical SAM protein [Spirochaetia bacterium]